MPLEQKKYFSFFITSIDKVWDSLLSLFEKELVDVESLIFVYTEKLLDTLKIKDTLYGYYDKQLLKLLDIKLIESYLNNPEDHKLKGDLEKHLYFLAIATNNIPELNIYNNQEWHEIIASRTILHDKARYIHTLRQDLGGQYRDSNALYYSDYLETRLIGVNTEMSFFEALSYTLMIDNIWLSFNSLSGDDKKIVLQKYFYMGMVIDAPVSVYIMKFLSSTVDVLDYLNADQLLLESLKNNQEILVKIDGSESKYATFADIVTDYQKQFGEKGKKIYDYAKELYPNGDNKELFSGWLDSALYIFDGAQKGNLIDRNEHGGEKTEDEIYYDQGVMLMNYFFDNPSWPKIAGYYQVPAPLFPLKNLLRELSENVDLTKEKAVEKITEFSNFLHENKILDADKEILEFHLKDEQFHWSDWINK